MKILALFIVVMVTSCVTHTPATNTRLQVGYEADKGAFVSVKFFDSNVVMESLNDLYEFIAGEDEERQE